MERLPRTTGTLRRAVPAGRRENYTELIVASGDNRHKPAALAVKKLMAALNK